VAVEPIKRERKLRQPILGFDTEYDSKTGALVSFQLSNGKRDTFETARKLTVDRLAKSVRALIPPEATEVVLAAFFSIAELQHLPVVEEAVEIKSFGASLDATFYSRRHSLSMRVFDLARFWSSPRKSLAQVAESYGLAKMVGVNRSNVSARSARSRKFQEYAKRDARLCWQIVERLREGFEPENVDPIYEGSPASSAAAAFRHRLSSTLHPPATRVRLMGLLACWGGRAEALERGSFARLHEYDLSSAYPQAAISLGLFPRRGDWKSVDSWRGFEGMVGGLGRFRFRFPADCLYPCLPVWTKRCQIYPLQGETYCTLDEARLARKMGATLYVVEAYAYRTGTPILSDYMRDKVSERASSKDPIRRTALKLLANSLIGKLAQRVVGPDLESLIQLARTKSLDLGSIVRLTREECIALGIPLHVRLGAMFFPEWNSLITGRVRAQLGKAVEETGAIYASTDAVWSRVKKSPSAYLGAVWGYVRSGPAVVARTRLARIGDHVAHHSIWKREAGERVLESVAAGTDESVRYTVRRPLKLKESLSKGSRYGVWIEEEREARGNWDHKRRTPGADSDGECRSRDRRSGTRTVPWDSATDYLAAAQAYAQARRQAARKGSSGRKCGGHRAG